MSNLLPGGFGHRGVFNCKFGGYKQLNVNGTSNIGIPKTKGLHDLQPL